MSFVPSIPAKVATTPTPKLPTFEPTLANAGDIVPEGAVAIVIPAEVWASLASDPLVRSKDGTGSTARTCGITELPVLAMPRKDGGNVPVKLDVNLWVPLDKDGKPRRSLIGG